MEKVLIVDDDARLAAELAGQLASEFMVAVFTKARDALSFLSSEDVAAVILEIEMGAEEGEEMFFWLCRADPRIALIVHSRDKDLRHVIRTMKLGADDYVVKPGNLVRVAQALREALRNRGAHNNRETAPSRPSDKCLALSLSA